MLGQVYLTNEQIARIAALSLDGLYGAEINSTTEQNSYAAVTIADLESGGNHNKHYIVEPDGSFKDVT